MSESSKILFFILQLENQKENVEIQLQEKGKELAAKESLLSAMDAAVVK